MTNEIWKTVKDYENYEVSNLGNVRSKKTGKILRPAPQQSGYLLVCLCKNGKGKTFPVHRLVLQTFEPIDDNDYLEANHINYNKLDNRLENLEWVTHSANVLHGPCETELRVLVTLMYNSMKIYLRKYVNEIKQTKGTKEEFADKFGENIIEILKDAAIKDNNHILNTAFKKTIDEINKQVA